MNALRRYYLAYFVYRVKLWLLGARITDAYLSTVDSIDAPDCAYTRLDVDSVIAITEFDYVTYNGVSSRIMYDIMEVSNLLNSEAPYYRYAAWRWKLAQEQVA